MATTIQQIELPKKARALDTSSGWQTVGSNLITNGDFATGDFTGWNESASNGGVKSIVSGAARLDATAASDSKMQIYQDVAEQGSSYRVTFTVTNYNDDTTTCRVINTAGVLLFHILANGTHTFDFTHSVSSGNIFFRADQGGLYDVDNISILKLENFPNNNHGQIYSGRGLEFDGITDYLDAGIVFSETNHTVAFWAMANDNSTTTMIADTRDLSEDGFLIGFNASNIIQAKINDATTLTSTYSYINTWVRVVHTYDGVTQKIYINGVLDVSQSVTKTLDTTRDLVIGRKNYGIANWFDGYLSDFQAWDTAWSAADVTYDYLNPESLALNNGGTALTESNLKLWYPMQDGHRGQQSYILDGANTGLGDEKVTNGGFDTDLSGWTGQAGRGSYAWDSSRAKITNDDTSSYPNLYQSVTTVAGQVYKVNATVEIGTASTIEVRVYDGANLGSQQLTTDGEVEFYFTAVGTSTSLILYLWETGSTGHYCFFDNVSLKAINDKNHATTVFYGDELVENESFATSSDWTPQTGWTVSGNGVATVDSSAAGTTNVTSTDMAVVVGRTYYAEMVVDSASGTGLRFDLGGVSGGSYLTTTGLRTATITALTTAGFSMTASGSDTAAQISRVSVKEVGVASGWTDADQQLHIPQTALQSYNELLHGFSTETSGAAYVSIADDAALDVGTGDFSMSLWFKTDDDYDGYTALWRKGGWGSEGYSIGFTSSNKLAINTATTPGGNDWGYTDTAIEKGKWYHVVGVWDRSANQTLYLNGVEQTMANNYDISENTGSLDNSSSAAIGGASGSRFAGCITEVALFKTIVLSDAEVLELYNDGKALDVTTHSQYSTVTGYWRNNGLSTWNDLSTNSNNGTVTGTETILIPQGVDSTRDAQGFIMNKQKDTSSLNMSSMEDYVEIGDNDTLDFGTGDFTIECWAKFAFINKNSTWNSVVSLGGSIVSTTSAGLATKSGKFYFNIGGTTTIGSTPTLVVGDWYHVVGTRTGTTMRLYIDSVVESSTATSSQTVTNTSNKTIGDDTDATYNRAYEDAIDGVKIYNKALDGTEILRNYNATKGSHRN